MGTITKPEKALLIVGLLYTNDAVYARAQLMMQKKWGPLLKASEAVPFTHTDYYTAELGHGIKRRYCAYQRLIPKDSLPKLKCTANALEKKFCRQGKRQINIDPGYLDLAKVVLASTKDYAHRLYMGRGIYGEVTLMFRQGSFMTLPWTYPDYKEAHTLAFFNELREEYHSRLKAQQRSVLST